MEEGEEQATEGQKQSGVEMAGVGREDLVAAALDVRGGAWEEDGGEREREERSVEGMAGQGVEEGGEKQDGGASEEVHSLIQGEQEGVEALDAEGVVGEEGVYGGVRGKGGDAKVEAEVRRMGSGGSRSGEGSGQKGFADEMETAKGVDADRQWGKRDHGWGAGSQMAGKERGGFGNVTGIRAREFGGAERIDGDAMPALGEGVGAGEVSAEV